MDSGDAQRGDGGERSHGEGTTTAALGNGSSDDARQQSKRRLTASAAETKEERESREGRRSRCRLCSEKATDARTEDGVEMRAEEEGGETATFRPWRQQRTASKEKAVDAAGRGCWRDGEEALRKQRGCRWLDFCGVEKETEERRPRLMAAAASWEGGRDGDAGGEQGEKRWRSAMAAFGGGEEEAVVIVARVKEDEGGEGRYWRVATVELGEGNQKQEGGKKAVGGGEEEKRRKIGNGKVEPSHRQ